MKTRQCFHNIAHQVVIQTNHTPRRFRIARDCPQSVRRQVFHDPGLGLLGRYLQSLHEQLQLKQLPIKFRDLRIHLPTPRYEHDFRLHVPAFKAPLIHHRSVLGSDPTGRICAFHQEIDPVDHDISALVDQSFESLEVGHQIEVHDYCREFFLGQGPAVHRQVLEVGQKRDLLHLGDGVPLEEELRGRSHHAVHRLGGDHHVLLRVQVHVLAGAYVPGPVLEEGRNRGGEDRWGDPVALDRKHLDLVDLVVRQYLRTIDRSVAAYHSVAWKST